MNITMNTTTTTTTAATTTTTTITTTKPSCTHMSVSQRHAEGARPPRRRTYVSLTFGLLSQSRS